MLVQLASNDVERLGVGRGMDHRRAPAARCLARMRRVARRALGTESGTSAIASRSRARHDRHQTGVHHGEKLPELNM
ncbi:hypothetical protein CS379_28300 [Methylobacterium frigidaeris]|nr:hypothetical protein CS379_28300 [Methylobacterium frigidaeris]